MYNPLAAQNGITPVRTLDSGVGEAGSEVVAVDAGRVYVTNGAENRIDIFDAATGDLADTIDLSGLPGGGGTVNSVAAQGGLIAAAVARDPVEGEPQPGLIAIYDAETLDLIEAVEVGTLPDMVRFSADGTQIYAAIEGEFDEDLATQAKGGVAVIDIDGDTITAETYTFAIFDGTEDTLRDAGVRIFPGQSASDDFEPEYIAIDPVTGNLLVTLQEANTVAVFDLDTRTFTTLLPLGTVDHSKPRNALDPNDEDGAIAIATHDIRGLRMPDAIAAFAVDGETYFATANEGDDRGEAERVGDILAGDIDGVSIDPSVDTTGLDRLNVSIVDGDTDGDGDIDVLHSYGGRGFTIYDADGDVVFESGAQFERLIARHRVPNAFNNEDFPSDDPDVIDDNRSDNKGPEPEAIAVGQIGDTLFAFVGLERDSGIMVYDITDPAKARFATYIESSANGDVSPEVIQFIPASDSPTGEPMLAVSYEVSGTTVLIGIPDAVDARQLGTAVTGTLLDDRIVGGGADQVIAGGAGDDRLFGLAGDDTMIGGVGRDTLLGGRGDDTFVWREGDGRDVVRNFADGDVIDLAGLGLTFEDLVFDAVSDRRTVIDVGAGRIVVTHADTFAFDAGDFILA